MSDKKILEDYQSVLKLMLDDDREKVERYTKQQFEEGVNHDRRRRHRTTYWEMVVIALFVSIFTGAGAMVGILMWKSADTRERVNASDVAEVREECLSCYLKLEECEG